MEALEHKIGDTLKREINRKNMRLYGEPEVIKTALF
jgi:hypothetical protein